MLFIKTTETPDICSMGAKFYSKIPISRPILELRMSEWWSFKRMTVGRDNKIKIDLLINDMKKLT